ncbi:MAG TPA: TrmH family RNA methyltransferase [Chitinophagaceae bacterium]|nr:TrmH family RNA methyltransferase [Chitinophagaceae bacterium]
MSKYKKKSMEELYRLDKEENKNAKKFPIKILLEDVRSMHNVGSCFRTSDAFQVEEIILSGLSPQPPHKEIHKTALGATETVAWRSINDIYQEIEILKKEGYIILSLEQAHDSIPLNQYPFSSDEKYVFIFGHEVWGVQQDTINASHACIEIPQFGTKHSLNISVCIGITLWTAIQNYIS